MFVYPILTAPGRRAVASSRPQRAPALSSAPLDLSPSTAVASGEPPAQLEEPPSQHTAGQPARTVDFNSAAVAAGPEGTASSGLAANSPPPAAAPPQRFPSLTNPADPRAHRGGQVDRVDRHGPTGPPRRPYHSARPGIGPARIHQNPDPAAAPGPGPAGTRHPAAARGRPRRRPGSRPTMQPRQRQRARPPAPRRWPSCPPRAGSAARCGKRGHASCSPSSPGSKCACPARESDSAP